MGAESGETERRNAERRDPEGQDSERDPERRVADRRLSDRPGFSVAATIAISIGGVMLVGAVVMGVLLLLDVV